MVNTTANINKKNLLPLWLTMFCNTFSYTMIFPALTFAIYDAHSSLFAPDVSLSHRAWIYGLCMGFMHVGGIVATPIMTLLTDLMGRKKLLALATAGNLIFALLTIAGLWRGDITYVLYGSLLTGLFSRADPIAQAIVGDTTIQANKIKIMGLLQFVISLGALIGPITGGWLTHASTTDIFANFYLPFIAATLFALIAAMSALGFLPETLSMNTKTNWSKQRIKNILLPLWNKQVIKTSLILLFSQITWSFYYQFMPPVLKQSFNYSASLVGAFLSVIALWLAIAALVGSDIVQRQRNKRRLIRYLALGLFIGAVLNTQALFEHSQYLLWLSALPIASCDVLLYCIITALYSEAVPSTSQGAVMGLCFIVIAIVWSFTGIFGGMLGASHHELPLIVAPIGSLVLLFL
jgi:MFS family permease